MKRIANISDFPKQPHYIMIEVMKYENGNGSVQTNHPIFATLDRADLETTVKASLMKGNNILVFDLNGSAIPTLELNLNLKKEAPVQQPAAKSPEIQIHEE